MYKWELLVCDKYNNFGVSGVVGGQSVTWRVKIYTTGMCDKQASGSENKTLAEVQMYLKYIKNKSQSEGTMWRAK